MSWLFAPMAESLAWAALVVALFGLLSMAVFVLMVRWRR